MIYEKKTYKELYIKFAWQFCLFLVILNVSAGIFKAIEQHDDQDEEGKKWPTAIEVIRNFSMNYNVSKTELIHLYKNVSRARYRFHGFESASMTYMEGFVLAMSLFTTIGWGHVTPMSFAGGLFTIIISCIGIPITFMMIFNGGQILVQLITDLVEKFLKRYGSGRIKNRETLIVIPVMVVLLVFYILLMSAFIAKLDGYNYEHAIYYTFISLSTIGLGDIAQGGMLEEHNAGKAFGLALFFFFSILIGLIFVAATIVSVHTHNTSGVILQTRAHVATNEYDDDNDLVDNDDL